MTISSAPGTTWSSRADAGGKLDGFPGRPQDHHEDAPGRHLRQRQPGDRRGRRLVDPARHQARTGRRHRYRAVGLHPENVDSWSAPTSARSRSSPPSRSAPTSCSSRSPVPRSASSTARSRWSMRERRYGPRLAEGQRRTERPVQLSQWRPNDILIAERNEDYWGGAPAMQRVIMRHIPESGSLRLQIEAGDVDVGQYVAADLDGWPRTRACVIENVPGFGFYYIALNMKDPRSCRSRRSARPSSTCSTGRPWPSPPCAIRLPVAVDRPQGHAGRPRGDASTSTIRRRRSSCWPRRAIRTASRRSSIRPAPAASAERRAAAGQRQAAGVELELVPGGHTPAFRDRNFEVYMGNSGAATARPVRDRDPLRLQSGQPRRGQARQLLSVAHRPGQARAHQAWSTSPRASSIPPSARRSSPRWRAPIARWTRR